MPRLPVVGSDDGTWGDVLNDFLGVVHNTDGTLKDGTVGPTKLTQTYIQTSEKGAASGVATLGTNSRIPLSQIPTQIALSMATASDPEPALKITQPNSTISSSTELMQVFHGTGADKTFWLNEFGMPRARVPSDKNGEAYFKGFVGSSYTGMPFQLFRDGSSSDFQFVIHADGSISIAETSTPSAPGTQMHRFYPKSDGRFYKKNSSGTESTFAYTSDLKTRTMPYSYGGTLAVNTGTFRLYNDSGIAWTIQGVRATVGTAPSGSSIIIDVHKNGTTIFTTQSNRPTIAAAANTSGKVTNMNVTSVADGEYLTVDIDQIGSGTAGSDLTVQVEVL